MGMLDGMLGSLMSGMQGGGNTGTQQSPLLQIALQLMQQNGGLQGILTKFQQAGYGAQAGSWVSTGQNMPISGDVLSQVFGQGQLGQIAQQLGMSHGDAAGGLSVSPAADDRQDDPARAVAGRSPGHGRAGARAAEPEDGLSAR